MSVSGSQHSVMASSTLPTADVLAPLLDLSTTTVEQVVEQLKAAPRQELATTENQQQLEDSVRKFLLAVVNKCQESSRQSEPERGSGTEEEKALWRVEKTQLEQTIHEYETDARGLRDQINSLQEQASSLQKQLDETNSKRAELQSLSEKSSSRISAYKEAEEALTSRKDSLEAEKRQLLQDIAEYRRELDARSAEIRQLKDEHIRLRETLSEREEECVRLRSEAQTTDLRELSHKQAMELSRKQIEWLNAELTASQEGLQKARSELAATKSELHSQLSAAKAELRSTTSSLDECQRRTKQAEASHYNSMQEVRKIKEELAEATEQFKREMRSQAKMCEIWEKSAKEATTRVEEIDRLLQEAESRRKEAEQQAQEAVELAESERDELARQLDRANETIRRFERELDTVNKSIESGTNLISPSASRVMRSGKTPTQILAEFNELQDEYDRVLAERNDLESSLNAILQDIEERAPVLAFEREAFEKLQLYCDDLARELEAMRGDLEESQSQERERANELQVAHRENKSLRQQVRDLGRQVSRLIRQIEEIRRGSPIPDSEAFEPNSIDSNEGQIDRVISQSLVTFRDIQELQLQNQRLLRTTRELASKVAQEEEDRRKQLQAEENEAIAEAKNVISRLESELRTLRTRLGALERERNMLKERAERKSPGDHSERKPQPGVEPSAEDATVSKDDNTQLRRLEDQFNLYQSESVSIRQTLERENEGLRSELSETRIRAVKAEAQVAFEQDRIGMLKSEQDALLRELAHLRETVSRLHAQLESYEQSSTQAAQSLAETTSELQQAKRMLAMVEAERDALRRSEARWLEAEQQWRSEKLNMTQILQNTTRLRDEWQRASEAKVAAAEQQIESIRGDLASAREEIRAKDGEIQRLQYRREADTSLWQERVTKLNDALGDAKEQTAQARQKVAEIQVRLAENQGEISSLKQQLQRYVEKESEEREHVERLRLQGQEPTRESMLLSELGEAKGRQQQLEAELEKARKRCYEFQALSQQNESALAQLNETYDAYKLEKENAIAEMRRSLEVAEKRRDELQVRAEELEADLKAQKEELAQLSQARANKEAELQRRISSLEEFKKMYEGNLNQLRQDLTRQTELTREAQENYERELVSHAKDVQVTLASREGWSATKKELAHVTTELEAARKEVESERARFSELQSTHESRIAEHEERIASLRKQNEILMSYLAAVGHDTGSIDFDNPEPPKTDATTAATTGDSRSAGQLGEVIVQLRRERELLSAQLELTQQETRRWHQQATHIQRALDQAREELKGSASKSQAEDVDSGRDELQASILRESNITLRVELQQARDRLKVVEARLHEFEDKIVPELRGSKAELEAELSARKADIEQLERMNQRWKERHEQILAKYDRVDPEELHELQAKLAEHQDKYAALNSELAACRKEMSTLTKTKAMLEARIKHASNVIEAKTESIKNLEARQESAKTSYEGQIKQLRERVAELQSKLGQAQQQQQQQQQQSVQQNTSAAQEGEIQSLKSRIEDYNQQLNHARETLARNSTTLHSVRQELHTSRSEVGTLKSRLQGLEEDNKNLTENYNLAQRLAINYLSDIKALKLQIDACKDQAQATNRAQSLPPASAQQHTSATEQSIPSSHPVLSTQKPAIFSSAEPPAQSDAPTSTAADDDKDTKSTQQTVVSSAAGEGSVDSSTPAPSAFSKVDSTVATTATATVVIPASHPTLTPAPATSTASTGKPMTPNDLKMKLRMMKQSLKREQDSSPVKTGTVQSQIQSQATPPPAGTPDFPRTTTQTGLAVAAPDAAQVSPTPITLKRPSEEEHGVDKRPHVLGSSSNADAQSSTNADEAQPPTTKDDDTSVPTIQKASDADVASPAQNVVSENNVDK